MTRRPGNDQRAGTCLCDFVVRAAIIPELAAASREGVIREMVASLGAAGALPPGDLEEVVHAILQRERLGTTGIGRGVAIPHARHGSVDRVIGTLAVSPGGMSFSSLDGQPVYLFVLLITPPDRPGDHLRALEAVSRCLGDDQFVLALRSAPTREAISALLDQKERG